MGYQDQNADERTADSDERFQDRHDAAADRADEERDDLALEDGSYSAYWLNRVTR